MFDRENIFTAGEGMGGKFYVLQISQWQWGKLEGKTHIYERLLSMSKSTPPQSRSWKMSSDGRLLSTPKYSAEFPVFTVCVFITMTCPTD